MSTKLTGGAHFMQYGLWPGECGPCWDHHTHMVDESGAQFSSDRTFRYALWRTWAGERGHLMIVGHNPSTADEMTNDRTISREIGFAQRWNYGGLYKLNIGAYRATHPKDLDHIDDPIGPANWGFIDMYADSAARIVIACGIPHKKLRREFQLVVEHLDKKGVLWCFGTTKDGWPRHPLYLLDNTQLVRYQTIQ